MNPPDLFAAAGLPPALPPAPDLDGLLRAYVRHVRAGHAESFNSFRHRHGLRVPPWAGVVVGHVCRRAGLLPAGFELAAAPASHGRLCRTWRAP